MNRLRIRHETGFHYDGEVTASYNEARMLPVSTDGQLVLFSNLEILPISSHHSYTDYWGTRVSSFEILTPHRELSLAATSLVEVRPQAHAQHLLGWEALADEIERATEYVEQLGQTRRTLPPDELVELAREALAKADSPCDTARAICEQVGNRIEYMPGSTMFLVWTQSRQGYINNGEFEGRESFDRMLDETPDNIFLVKVTYYLNL